MSTSALPFEPSGGRDAPRDYLALRLRIGECYPELTPHLQAIARFALGHPDAMAVERVTQLATMIGVQPSSIVRFAKLLGFEGVKGMRPLFKDQLLYNNALRPGPTGGDTSAPRDVSRTERLVEQAHANLNLLRGSLLPEIVEQAADLVLAADEIHVIAQQASFGVAHFLAWSFLALGRQTHLLDNVGGIALRQSELVKPLDLAIAVSFPPYAPSVIQAAEAHAERGGKVLAITDTPVSPLVPVAQVVLEAPDAEARHLRSMIAPMCVAHVLVDAVRERLATAAEGSKQPQH
ncbi:MAG: MurR/RpiR family transcriptional regulator [Pseudomonadota bacterium]